MKDKSLSPKSDEIELRPDGWDRFKQAVHAAAKSGPKHRPSQTDSQPKPSVIKDSGKL